MKNKFSIALSLAVVFALLVTSLALADNIVNDVVATVDDTFTAPGSTVVRYKVNSTGGDNQVGCNASDGTPLTITLNVPAGVTSSTTSLTFNACNVFQSVTFSSSVAGNYPITISTISDGGTGTYKNEANFTLHVLAPPPPPNTAPTVSVTGVTSGASYEYGTVPAAVCSVVDAEDGNSSFAASLSAITGPLSSYGLGSQTASCSYTDAGGLTASASATYSIVDTALPQVSCGSADGLWHAVDVSIPCTASDNVALANPADASFSLSTNVPAGTEDSNASTNSYDVYDVAGNVATAGPISGNKIDKKAPTNINFVGGGITDGGSYYFGFVPAGPASCTADDGGSGLASCDVTGGGTTVGVHSFTAKATDHVGNSDTATMSYTVLAWTLNGFYQPVDMNGVFNVVKGGSTVPLKFEVFAGANELTDISAIKSFAQTKVACDGSAPTDNIELTTTGGTTLRYDILGGQFIQNWQTPKLPGQCYKVTMTTQDGSALVAFFRLK
jgi:hypothetical protein